ncbi:glycosyltransferase family 4 protein, partial [Patescibacteria group bacterium]
TKKDLCRQYLGIESKTSVTLEACDLVGEINEDKERDFLIMKKYGIIKPYALYVGNAYPHKNLERLIRVFSRIEKGNSKLNLVLVGKEDFFYKKLKALVRDLDAKNIIFTGFVDDGDLNIAYRNSKMYVFPSLYEGFGLPPLEAMNRGIPVACSDHECMQEILGGSAYYFDGEDEKSMMNAILNLDNGKDLRSNLIKKGVRQSGKYDWGRMAEETKTIYEKVI